MSFTIAIDQRRRLIENYPENRTKSLTTKQAWTNLKEWRNNELKREWSMKETTHWVVIVNLIQCDIKPYRHYLSLPGDLVPWVCCFSHSKNLLQCCSSCCGVVRKVGWTQSLADKLTFMVLSLLGCDLRPFFLCTPILLRLIRISISSFSPPSLPSTLRASSHVLRLQLETLRVFIKALWLPFALRIHLLLLLNLLTLLFWWHFVDEFHFLLSITHYNH